MESHPRLPGRDVAPLTLLAFLAVLAVSGCDADEGGSTEALELSVYTAPTAADPFRDVGSMVLKVTGPDLGAGVTEIVPFVPVGSGTVSGVAFGAAGAERQVVVEGWAHTPQGELSHVVSRGRSVRTSVDPASGNVRSLPVLLARVNSFLTLTDASARQGQALERGRVGHTVTHTAAGEVVVAGGGLASDDGAWWAADGLESITDGVEIVDERSHRKGVHQRGLDTARAWHTATDIGTGQVALVGGWKADGVATGRAELVNPGAGSEGQTLPGLAKARAGHSATLVDPESFTVLFVGGDVNGEPTFELWSPHTGSSGARELPNGVHRRHHAAVYFEAADTANPEAPRRPAVLIVGGESADGPLASALVYDITSDTMLGQPSGLQKGARTQLTGTWVPGQGKVYLVGGFTSLDRSEASDAIDVYDVNAASPEVAFRSDVGGFNMARERGGHTATLLDDESVLIAGGVGSGGGAAPTLEIIHQYFKEELDPDSGQAVLRPFITVAFDCDDPGCPDIPDLPEARFGHRAVLLDSGMVLLAGGASGGGGSTVTHPLDLTLYNPR